MKVETLGDSDKTPPVNYICRALPADDRAVSELFCMCLRMIRDSHDDVREGDYFLFPLVFECEYMLDETDQYPYMYVYG